MNDKKITSFTTKLLLHRRSMGGELMAAPTFGRSPSAAAVVLALLFSAFVFVHFSPEQVLKPGWSSSAAAAPWTEPHHAVHEEQHAYWAVVFTTGPAPVAKQIASLGHQWRVVVVTDGACSDDWLLPNVTCLSPQTSWKLGFSSLKHLPGAGSR